MARRGLSLLTIITIVLPMLAACASSRDPEAANDIRLYQILPVARSSSSLIQAEGEGEAIAIINAGQKPHAVGGWTVQTSEGSLVLPKLTMGPGQIIYLANNAEYFTKYWNFAPTFEYGRDVDKAVPDLKLSEGRAPVMPDKGGLVRLLDDHEKLVDIVVYGETDALAPWTGPAVQLVDASSLTPANQVLTRLRANGALQVEPQAEAWSGGSPANPGRVYFPGQSDFPATSVTGAATLTAASAPDNAGPLLFELVEKARRSIRLVGYRYENPELSGYLIEAARRGVKVQVAVNRNPGGGDLPQSEKAAHQLLAMGGVEVIYAYDWDGRLSSRYAPVNAKYALFDDESVLISTGDWTSSVYSAEPTCGNREWLLLIRGNPKVARLVKEVWEHDFGSVHREIRYWDEELDRPFLPDLPVVAACAPYESENLQPLTITSPQATITRILTPDNSLDTENGFLGLIGAARQELLISAHQIDLWWGAEGNRANLAEYPNPYITQIVEAARRGVDVKVLLDRREVMADNIRGNPYVVKYLNDLAAQEGLTLEARLVNLDGAGIGGAYHNQSLIVDGAVVISSIGGSENSFRHARELAFKVDGAPELTAYYRGLFTRDWEASLRPNRPGNLIAAPQERGTFVDWSQNAELDVIKYEVYYKSNPDAMAWVKLGETDRPGFADAHEQGLWGVVAVNRAGERSDYAQISR